MPNTFGALPLPVPTDEENETAEVDPAVAVLCDALPVIIRHWAEAAWRVLAPSEPLFRKVFSYDPERYDFSEKDVPALYVYREKDQTKDRIDGESPVESTIRVLWVEPPATQGKRANREPFFNAFAKALEQLVDHERHPSWIQDGDTTAASAAYGTSILNAAGFDFWKVAGINRTTIEVAVPEGKPRRYPGVLAILDVRERNESNLVERGFTALDDTTGAGGIDVLIKTGGTTPLTTGHIREPRIP